MKARLAPAAAIAVLLFVLAVTGRAGSLPLGKIELPEGFSISVWCDDVPDARSLARGPEGTIFVGSRKKRSVRAGAIYRITYEKPE